VGEEKVGEEEEVEEEGEEEWEEEVEGGEGEGVVHDTAINMKNMTNNCSAVPGSAKQSRA
jgi:hypothetical protein